MHKIKDLGSQWDKVIESNRKKKHLKKRKVYTRYYKDNFKVVVSRKNAVNLLINENIGLWKESLINTRAEQSKKYFMGIRGNYYVEDTTIKSNLLGTLLIMLEFLAYTGHKFYILTETHKVTLSNYKFKEIKAAFTRAQKYTYKIIWMQGHLRRHFSQTMAEDDRFRGKAGEDTRVKKTLKEIREEREALIYWKWNFPGCLISLSKEDRQIALKEGRKLSVPTFSFNTYSSGEFHASHYKFPLNTKKPYHVILMHWILLETIVNAKKFFIKAHTLFYKAALQRFKTYSKVLPLKKKILYKLFAIKKPKIFKKLQKKLVKGRLKKKYFKLESGLVRFSRFRFKKVNWRRWIAKHLKKKYLIVRFKKVNWRKQTYKCLQNKRHTSKPSRFLSKITRGQEIHNSLKAIKLYIRNPKKINATKKRARRNTAHYRTRTDTPFKRTRF